jgi:Phosphodiester glycosidase
MKSRTVAGLSVVALGAFLAGRWSASPVESTLVPLILSLSPKTIMMAVVACNRTPTVVPVAPPPPGMIFDAPIDHADSGREQLREQTWTVNGAAGWAIVVRFPRDATMTVVPSEAVTSLDLLASPSTDQAVTNGGFYDDGAMGLVVHEGVQRTSLSETGGSGIVEWAPGSRISIVHRDAWTGQGTEALQSVDRIVDRGASLVHPKADARETARTGLAVTDDAVLLVVAASNRSAEPAGSIRSLRAAEDHGLPLWAFADLMVHLGANEAINFDGGISVGLRANVAGSVWSVDGGAGTINAVLVAAP